MKFIYSDTRVDLVYRDAAVLDLIDLAEEGVDVAPMRAMLRQNRVVSSIAAELDQKSCFEVFTDPVLADKFLTEAEQQVMRRHVLWTTNPVSPEDDCSARRGDRSPGVREDAS